ncbi:MAG: preprotein translocase subunit SecY [Candidatus Moranbacteria bacterium]|nr:preprotein translocase subunit SecY [Candidatus Moranbacteria bacterium]
MQVWAKIKKIWKLKELRNKILFVFAMLVIFRAIAAIPVPDIDTTRLARFFENNQLFGLLNVFSGAGMDNFSLVMMGVGPYITSSIVMQLMTVVIPAVEKWYREEGEIGRKKFQQVTRILTVPFSLVQSFGMITLLKSQQVINQVQGLELVKIMIIVTAGTMFLMWLGELITEKGIGNGTSLIIFAGILANIPNAIRQTATTWDPTQLFSYVLFFAAAIIVIAGVVFVTEGQRNIPVTYARRVSGRGMVSSSSYLPLRVNQAGVIPIIFAMSILLFPNMIANVISTIGSEKVKDIALSVSSFLQNQWVYGIMYFLLVVAFTYFYTTVTFEPTKVGENLQKQGGYIPGVRPGRSTAEYLTRILNRVTLAGALFLGTIAVLPYIVQGLTHIQAMSIGGTSLLIAVSVALDSMKQVDSQLVMRDYDGFLKG